MSCDRPPVAVGGHKATAVVSGEPPFRPTQDRHACPACGVHYTDHLGLIGICQQLQDALLAKGGAEAIAEDRARRIDALQAKIDQARAALLLIWPQGAKHTHARDAFRALGPEGRGDHG